ncbi:unnamed protein product [Albugo candida]|uniref:Uncharacterized protein n=1 Tax=Albugo candida TaxID=65357 RepID=A0A024FYC1_9STRA|nr:unnamed protein product [Albugo candida]|eukprot:CCI11669.1 unnamed protein product [Albugo candida]
MINRMSLSSTISSLASWPRLFSAAGMRQNLSISLPYNSSYYFLMQNKARWRAECLRKGKLHNEETAMLCAHCFILSLDTIRNGRCCYFAVLRPRFPSLLLEFVMCISVRIVYSVITNFVLKKWISVSIVELYCMLVVLSTVIFHLTVHSS